MVMLIRNDSDKDARLCILKRREDVNLVGCEVPGFAFLEVEARFSERSAGQLLFGYRTSSKH
jgi:hypothetical protein